MAQSGKKLLYSSFDTIFLGYIETLLSQSGIPTEYRNQYVSGGVGELPPVDVTPELWVEEAVFARAEAIVQQATSNENDMAAQWVCPECGETIEGQFAQCWQCGYWREEDK